MLVANESNPSSNATDGLIHLYRHSKRTDWGLAAVMWEREGKRGYRFEDGNERVFKEGYYHLFESAPALGAAAESLLASIHRDRMADAAGGRSSSALPVRGPELEELVAVFHEEYADGFADAKWASKHRGEGVKRRAKRHRDVALREAAELLGREVLDARIEAGDHEEVIRRLVTVLGATDLVTKKQLEVLHRAAPTAVLARALRDLMHEPDLEGVRFDAVLKLLARSPGGNPSWSLMTAIRAVVDPQNDACIRPSVFFDAVRVVSPSQARKVSPQGGQYNRLAAIARDLRERLRALGEMPRDMLDIYDFIWATCRPAAAPVLARVRQRAAEAAEAKAAEAKAAEAKTDATVSAVAEAKANKAEVAPAEEAPMETTAEAA